MVEHFVKCFQEEVFNDFALKFKLDLQTVFLHLIPVVWTESEFPFKHVDDLGLVLLMDALQVLLVVDDVLLVNYTAPHTQDFTKP